MQTALSRIWTRDAEFISYNENHYTRDTSKTLCTSDVLYQYRINSQKKKNIDHKHFKTLF